MADKRCVYKCGAWNCGSYQFNLYKDEIDQGDLCDVHYWQTKAQRPWAFFLGVNKSPICPECNAFVLYECVACSSNNYPPSAMWQELTPEEILDLFDSNNVYGSKWIEFARTVEAKLKEKNTNH